MPNTEFPSIPGYQVQKLLGEGGMAKVYLAIQESFNRPVALKVMSPNLLSDPSFAQRFHREAQLAANLSHQNIVPIFDVGQHESFHYMAMEYLPGGDLKGKIDNGAQLLETLAIIKTIALALDYSGKKGLVHRDIKPENILFREDGSPAIADFGIARQINSQTNMTVFGSAVGTPNYMSPEQAQGAEIDGRADLYSLGIILYEMIAGTVPFVSESAISVSVKHITEAPAPLDPKFATFQPVIDKALAKDPNQRFQTGSEFAQVLTRLEDSMSVTFSKTVVLNTQDILTATRNSGINTPNVSGINASPDSYNTSLSNPSFNNGATPMYNQGTPPPAQAPKAANKFKYATTALGLLLVVAVGLLVALNFDQLGGSLLVSNDPSENAQGNTQQAGSSQSPAPQMVSQTRIKALARKAKESLQSGKLLSPEEDSAKFYVTTLLALAPSNSEGLIIVRTLYSRILAEAEQSLNLKDYTKTDELLKEASQLDYYIDDLALNERFKSIYEQYTEKKQYSLVEKEQNSKVTGLLAQASEALKQQRLTSPLGNNAYEFYQKVLAIVPSNQDALDGINNVAQALLAQAKGKADQRKFSSAHALLTSAIQIAPAHQLIDGTKQYIDEQQKQVALQKIQKKNTKDNSYKKAQQALEAERIAKQNQVTQLLKKANQAIAAGALTQPKSTSALFFFDSILKIDPSNKDALQGKQTVSRKLINKAISLANQGQIADARTVINSALKSGTSKFDAAQAQKEIDKIEQKTNIANYLAKASKSLSENRLQSPEGNNAHYYYQQVLSIASQNLEAKQGLNKIGHKYLQLANNAVSANKLSAAQKYLANAKQYLGNHTQVATIENRIAEAQESANAGKSKIAKLMSQGNQLLTSPSLDSLKSARSRFNQVLRIDPKNSAAKKAIAKSVKLQAELAELAIASNDIDEATQHINIIDQVLPSYNTDELRAKLNLAQAHDSRIDKHINEANRLITLPYNTPGLLETSDEPRQHLKQAYAEIDKARSIAPNSNQVVRAFSKLDERYAYIIGLLLAEKTDKEAHKFIADTAPYEWEGTKVKGIVAELNETSRTTRAIKLMTLSDTDKASTLLNEALELIAVPYITPGLLETNRPARDRLINAYNKIDTAEKLHPNEARIKQAFISLDEKYKQVVKTLRDENEHDEANNFMSDTNNYDWRDDTLGFFPKVRKPVQATPTNAQTPASTDKKVLATQYINNAEALIAKPYKLPKLLQTNDEPRKRLKEAYSNIMKLSALRNYTTKTKALLSALDEKYASVVALLIDNTRINDAKAFVADTAKYTWNKPKLALQEKRLADFNTASPSVKQDAVIGTKETPSTKSSNRVFGG